MTEDALAFTGVTLERERRCILDGIDWSVAAGERWVVLGANGSGKTSLLRLASGYLHPTAGTVEILGRRLGQVDVRALRRDIGLASGALAAMLRPGITAVDAVMAGKHAALETWWHHYDDADRAKAVSLLERMGCAHLAGQPLGTVSDGERQRIQLARTLMVDPQLLLLDEPTAGLDLTGREALVGRLAALAADAASPPTVLVTHHVEEIPPGFGHLLLLRAGCVLAAGPLRDVLTGDNLEECFGVRVHLEARDGRWLAWGK